MKLPSPSVRILTGRTYGNADRIIVYERIWALLQWSKPVQPITDPIKIDSSRAKAVCDKHFESVVLLKSG